MYKNPIPSLDDEYVSDHFAISVRFEDPMTAKDAAENIEHYIKVNGLPQGWVHPGAIKMLASPGQQNILKDKIMKPRLSGEWVSLGHKGDYNHCACSVCGHMEEAVHARETGSFSDEHTGTVYKFCPECGSSMAAGVKERAMVSRKLHIESPHGHMEAGLAPDDDFPGIAVTVLDEDGNEISYGIMEWNDTNKQFMLRVYPYRNPDGDPSYVIPMSRPYAGEDDRNIKDAVFAQVWESASGLEPVTLTTACRVNTNTGEVFDIDEITVVGFTKMQREYIMLDDTEYSVKAVTGGPDRYCYWYVKNGK